MRVTPLQAEEWRSLREDHPDALLVVAGDLNQSLGATHYYGTKAGRQLLGDCLRQADLTCLTDGDHLPRGCCSTRRSTTSAPRRLRAARWWRRSGVAGREGER